MGNDAIEFKDGKAYDLYMGAWSRLAGEAFLDWLAPEPGLNWLDVGCGNGAFTELIAARCAPSSLDGVDPSEAQLDFARKHPPLGSATFRKGDAMALPYPDAAFDAAVMPLVLFFVPDPAKGVAEMARVVRPGGLVTAYSWDMPGGGFPYFILQRELRNLGVTVPMPPHPEVAALDIQRGLWSAAGVVDLETLPITVMRSFADLEEYWAVVQGAPSMGPTLAALTPEQKTALRARLKELLPAEGDGRLVLSARAHAIKGRVRG